LYGLPRTSKRQTRAADNKEQAALLYPASGATPGHDGNRSLRPHSFVGPQFGRAVSQVRAAPV
ncbi:MAG TPA: hypothetical protein VFB54_09090, partial [Burkholderiales bacterium]|nr:hypothetical protein [Burkholderiales bacterium]